MDVLRLLDRGMSDLLEKKAVLSNVGLSLRSCGCEVLFFEFQGFQLDTFDQEKAALMGFLEKAPMAWNVCSLSAFPGSDLVRRLQVRQLCGHCRENFIMEKTIGLDAMVVEERL